MRITMPANSLLPSVKCKRRMDVSNRNLGRGSSIEKWNSLPDREKIGSSWTSRNMFPLTRRLTSARKWLHRKSALAARLPRSATRKLQEPEWKAWNSSVMPCLVHLMTMPQILPVPMKGLTKFGIFANTPSKRLRLLVFTLKEMPTSMHSAHTVPAAAMNLHAVRLPFYSTIIRNAVRNTAFSDRFLFETIFFIPVMTSCIADTGVKIYPTVSWIFISNPMDWFITVTEICSLDTITNISLNICRCGPCKCRS